VTTCWPHESRSPQYHACAPSNMSMIVSLTLSARVAHGTPHRHRGMLRRVKGAVRPDCPGGPQMLRRPKGRCALDLAAGRIRLALTLWSPRYHTEGP